MRREIPERTKSRKPRGKGRTVRTNLIVTKSGGKREVRKQEE